MTKAMIHQATWLVLFSAGAVAAGCSSSGSESDPSPRPSTVTSADAGTSTNPAPSGTSKSDAGTSSSSDSGSSGGNEFAGTCVSPNPPTESTITALPTCCEGNGGKAHCAPPGFLPDGADNVLDSCTGGGICVPDALLRTGGATPPACKSLLDLDGVCMSVCVPQVAGYKDILPQANCAADERCAPCVNPLDQKRTGACELGKLGVCK